LLELAAPPCLLHMTVDRLVPHSHTFGGVSRPWAECDNGLLENCSEYLRNANTAAQRHSRKRVTREIGCGKIITCCQIACNVAVSRKAAVRCSLAEDLRYREGEKCEDNRL
jgi:hypothetical protein